MKNTLALLLIMVLLPVCFLMAGEPVETRFFSLETDQGSTHITLNIEGDSVYGTKVWQPKVDHGTRGTFAGTLADDGIMKVVYEYVIEGSSQSEEEILKLDGDVLYIATGELEEGEGGRMVLKNPESVRFDTALTSVVVTEPQAGTPERQAIMEAMRGPVSKHIGLPVIFTGKVQQSDSWARFQGNVAVPEGQSPSEDKEEDLELDFFALLCEDENGVWTVNHWGFSGDISVREEAREKFPQAPWVLFE